MAPPLFPRRRSRAAPQPRAAPRRRPATSTRSGWLSVVTGMAATTAIWLTVGMAAPALAQTVDPAMEQVIGRLRTVIVGLLVALATLFLTVGGLRYLFAGGDPGQVEKAKITLRSAAIGYGLAALAPVLVRLLRFVVGA
jgi:hypothetical protein